MITRALEMLDNARPFERASAHCDIPCGIYDPITAQIAALTIIRMIDLMQALATENPDRVLVFHNSMARYIAVKEEHARKLKEEVAVIWGDYMKGPQLETYPETHGLVHSIMQLASRVKQTPDREVAMNLLDKVNRFAEIFWATKGVATKRAKAPYLPGEELVYPAV